MNFYPHHIGDYLTATAHLSWVEDCAYRRLLDVYYSREKCIPLDVAQAARLIRASAKDERKAVETVLSEFFLKSEDGWTHGRCEEEIEKAREAAGRARVNGKKGGRPPKKEPKANPEETQSVISGNPEESNSKAPITNPITNPITKDIYPGDVCLAMKSEGVASVNPSHPELQVLIEAGATVDMFAQASRKSVGMNKGNFAYVLAIVRSEMQEAAKTASTPLKKPNQTQAQERISHFTGKNTLEVSDVIVIAGN